MVQIDPGPTQLPLFVYGTLLPNQPNAALWGSAVARWEAAALAPAHLYDFGAYPMLVESDHGTVHGMIATIQPARYDAVLTRLDQLERYDPAQPDKGPYRRRVRHVQLSDGSNRPVWIYLGTPDLVKGLPRISHGDWAAHTVQHQARLHLWWRRHRHDYDSRPPGDAG